MFGSFNILTQLLVSRIKWLMTYKGTKIIKDTKIKSDVYGGSQHCEK